MNEEHDNMAEDDETTEETTKASAKRATRHPLALWSLALGGVAVVLLCVAGVATGQYALDDLGRWVIYCAAVPAIAAFVCGQIILAAIRRPRSEFSGHGMAMVSCVAAVVIVVAVCALLAWQSGVRNSRARACIANQRNICSGICQGMVECPATATSWKTSADIAPDYLKNPKTVCCPYAPGVPYPIDCGGRPSVVCPAWLKHPAEYTQHSYYYEGEPWKLQVCKMNMQTIVKCMDW